HHELDAATRARVVLFLLSWQKAWESQQGPPYLANYASDCVVGGRDRAAFEDHELHLFSLGSTLELHLGDLRVEEASLRGESLVRATFDQEYSSARLTDFGRKELLLRPTGDS